MSHLGSKDFRNIHEVQQERNDAIQKGLYGDIEKGGVGSGKHKTVEEFIRHHGSKGTSPSEEEVSEWSSKLKHKPEGGRMSPDAIKQAIKNSREYHENNK